MFGSAYFLSESILENMLMERCLLFVICTRLIFILVDISMIYSLAEYGYALKVDEKIDVYSYGVVLLELLTGKRPLDPEFGESVDIVEWIRRKIRHNKSLEEALDPSVGNSNYVLDEMVLVLRIAILCTAKFPKDRPTMRDVIMMLEEAKPRRKSSSNNETVAANNNQMSVFSTSPVNGLL